MSKQWQGKREINAVNANMLKQTDEPISDLENECMRKSDSHGLRDLMRVCLKEGVYKGQKVNE